MNKQSYRVVLNKARGQFVVVSEATPARGKSGRGACVALSVFMAAAHALATPTGANVTAGNASVQTGANVTTVQQTTQNAIIQWQNFSINSNETVRFIAPNASASTLNRVTGNLPTRIDGNLVGNGRVFLVNQNGIVVGKDGMVNVNGGFVASTQNVGDSDFMSGNMRFSGESGGRIEVLGKISAPGGDIVLMAPKTDIASSATLSAGHSIQLIAASDVSYSNGKFTVNLKDSDAGQITMAGAMEAANIKLQAVNHNLAALAINTTGSMRATGTQTNPDGSISLVASGSRGATTQLDGATLSARNADGSGGRVEVLGESVVLTGATVIDASARPDSSAAGAARNGGTVLIGGDFQGKNAAIHNAKNTSVGKDVRISADAAQGTAGTGEGGKVIVWADNDTYFAGRIDARGGAQGGNGGLVETSGKGSLEFQGRVDTTAAKGRTGTLWLDPTNITISNAANGADMGAGPTFGGTAATSNLNVTTLQTALASNNVVVDTTSPAAGAGNITVSDAVTWAGGNSLTLRAHQNIDVNAAITATGNGSINLVANQASGGTGNVNVAAAVSTVGGNIAISGVNVTSTSGSLSTNAAADGNAGSVTITATGAVDVGAITAKGGDSTTGVGGNGGAVTISAGGAATLGANSATNTDTSGGASTVAAGGDAGAVSVTSNGTLWAKAYILARGGDGASGFATGRGGNLSLTNNSTTTGDILFNADLHSTRGQAGNVTVDNKAVGRDVTNVDLLGLYNVDLSGATAGSMTVSSQGRVLMADVNQTGTVRGGDSNITATGDIGYNTDASGSTPSTPNTNGGDGGNITLTSTAGEISAAELSITNSNVKTGSGNAYLIYNSQGALLNTQGAPRTGTGQAGRGGDITLTAANVRVKLLETNAASAGNGVSGNITINGNTTLELGPSFQMLGSPSAAGRGTLTFNGTVNGDELNLISAGHVVFNGAVGDVLPIALTTAASTFLTYTFNGGLFATNTNISLQNQSIVLGGANTFRTTGGSRSIAFGRFTSNNHTVTLESTGAITATNAANDFAAVNVTSAGDVNLRDANAITVGAMSARSVIVNAGGDLTMGGNVTTTGTGNSIRLQTTGNFINNGNHTLTAGTGTGTDRWLVYSTNPLADTRGTPLNNAYNFKQYATAAGGTINASATGNGFIYSVAPTLTGTLSGTATRTYNGTNSAPASSLTYSGSGLGGDTVSVTGSFASATYDNRNAGSGKTVTATVSGLANGAVTDSNGRPVFGYSNTSTASAAVGTINQAAVTVTAVTDTKVFDGTTSSSRSPSVSGLQTGDSIATAATQTYDTSAVGTGKTMTASGLVINDGNSGNNYTVSYQTNNTGVINNARPPAPVPPVIPQPQSLPQAAPPEVRRVVADLGCGPLGVLAGHMKAFMGPRTEEAPRTAEVECPTFQWKDLEVDLPKPVASVAQLSLPTDSSELVEMPAQGVLRLYASPILFKTGSYAISAEGRKYLGRFVEALKNYPDPVDRVEIKGYADITGNPSSNLVLSNNRAKAVQRFLASQDIQYPMLTRGYGDKQPIADCTGMARPQAVQCLQANRRVTLGVYILPPQEANP